MDPRQVRLQRRVAGRLGADAVGAFHVDDAAIDEPVEGVVERRAASRAGSHRRFVGVQEVEGVVEFDVVGVASDRWSGRVNIMSITTLCLVDRLRARGYITSNHKRQQLPNGDQGDGMTAYRRIGPS